MTATDEMRKLLDERKADYRVHQGITNGSMSYYDRYTVLIDGNPRASIDTGNGDEVVLTLRCTPEQAIAATLGRGTCHDVYPNAAYCFTCSECGHIRRFVQGWNNVTNSSQDEFNYCPNCGARVERREQ